MPYTPKNNDFWSGALDPDIAWQTAYATVEHEAREYLAQMPGPSVSTNGLVEAIFPLMSTRGAGIDARNRIYKALKAAATHGMRDCVSEGPLEMMYGKQIRRNIWLKPRPKCKACNGTGIENAS